MEPSYLYENMELTFISRNKPAVYRVLRSNTLLQELHVCVIFVIQVNTVYKTVL